MYEEPDGLLKLNLSEKAGNEKRVIACILVTAVFLILVPHVFSLTAKQQPGQKVERFTGRVISISASDMKMAVESMKAGMTFEIGGARLNGYRTINNIKEGGRVTVQYVMHQGKATGAHHHEEQVPSGG